MTRYAEFCVDCVEGKFTPNSNVNSTSEHKQALDSTRNDSNSTTSGTTDQDTKHHHQPANAGTTSSSAQWMKALSKPPVFRSVPLNEISPITDDEVDRLVAEMKEKAVRKEKAEVEAWTLDRAKGEGNGEVIAAPTGVMESPSAVVESRARL
jgi:hypothetical protein